MCICFQFTFLDLVMLDFGWKFAVVKQDCPLTHSNDKLCAELISIGKVDSLVLADFSLATCRT